MPKPQTLGRIPATVLADLFLKFVLAALFGIGVDESYATVFGTPDDKLAGGGLACQAGRVIPQDEPLCAHRWLPCGSKIVVMNLEHPSVTTCRVGDRGPYGVDRATNRWRGILDLTPGAARAARLDGRDLVRILFKLPPPGDRTYSDTRFLAPPPKRRTAGL